MQLNLNQIIVRWLRRCTSSEPEKADNTIRKFESTTDYT